MKQLNEHHTFTGMQRDIDVLKHPANFLYDAKNVRLTAREDNTLFAISTEKGTADTQIVLNGTYLGHCVLNQYLVVFTTTYNENAENDANPDYIYRIDMDNNGSEYWPTKVFTLYNGNLNFSTDYPIDAISSYENTVIQKIYWTDGCNQPRVINIVDGRMTGRNPNDSSDFTPFNDAYFDFARELQLNETVVVEKLLGSAGGFAPGVIQYAFTYYTKYGQESNIFYTTPLMYIAHKDRGAAPDDKVENAFKINIFNPDTNFDYIRVYSIQRTSVDGTPIVKRVVDLEISAYISGINSTLSSEVSSVTANSFPVAYTENKSYLLSGIDLSDVRTKNINLDGTIKEWYYFTNKDNPNLRIKYTDENSEEKYVTWGSLRTTTNIEISNPELCAFWIEKIDTSEVVLNPEIKMYITLNTRNTQKCWMQILNVTESSGNGITFTDTGTEGDSVDPTELLYKGGENIKAGTLEQKDGTLFLGNIKISRPQIKETLKNNLKNVLLSPSTRDFIPEVISDSATTYGYENQLHSIEEVSVDENTTYNKSVPCGGFKRGDYYRCGVQFQYMNGKWSDPVYIADYRVTSTPDIGLVNNVWKVTVPTITGTIQSVYAKQLLALGYKKARAVVVYPDIQDRVSICQGIVSPAVKLNNNDSINKYQSSWFFRPDNTEEESLIAEDGTVSLNNTTIEYRTEDPSNIRRIEIEGTYSSSDTFVVTNDVLTYHSPDIEFDTKLLTLSFEDTCCYEVGKATITKTLSDIKIQTETPTISSNANGFMHKSSSLSSSKGFVTGLFYEDYLVDDDHTDPTPIRAYRLEKSPLKWFVYPWNKTGSLNNDSERPTNLGVRSSVLKKKVLSNLRYTKTYWWNSQLADPVDCSPNIQIFNSDNLSVLKSGSKIYNGNVDTVLSPSDSEGMYFAFGNNSSSPTQIKEINTFTPFNSTIYWKTGSTTGTIGSTTYTENLGLYYWYVDSEDSSNNEWRKSNDGKIGDDYSILSVNKESVRMKYKSSPHALLPFTLSPSMLPLNESAFHIYEILHKDDGDQNHIGYRLSMFGGNTSFGSPIASALQSNNWVPCGEPVDLIADDNVNTTFKYSYGDTYYQRWDCLKTYPYTQEDINQIVEIGSFMLETRVNIDGRYDRNRGLIDNTNITPQNFNLLNPVYSQINNFFSYKILDEQYYSLNRFPNEITWTKEKSAGADVDLWTNITMSSTYDMDGSKGEVVSLNTWKDNLYCFQNKGVSAILFNSRVQIPTSDGVPIEITNSYKVDGYRFLSDGVGCNKKELIKETPAGVYFMDSITNHLYYIGEGIQDISATHNMSSWFNSNGSTISRLAYDDIHKDIYLVNPDNSLCFSELLGQFTSFMDYSNISLISTYNERIFTLKDSNLYSMFEGDYNLFFDDYHPWEISFISNGADSGMSDIPKIFTNIDYRMKSDENAQPNGYESSLDIIRVVDSYQDTDTVALNRRKRITYPSETSADVVQANLKKKFSTWRIQIPRDKNHRFDRIRDTWCKITLTCNGYYYLIDGEDLKVGQKTVLHDLNVQYYI